MCYSDSYKIYQTIFGSVGIYTYVYIIYSYMFTVAVFCFIYIDLYKELEQEKYVTGSAKTHHVRVFYTALQKQL